MLNRFVLAFFSAGLFWLGSPGGPVPLAAWAHLIPLAWAMRSVSPAEGARIGFVYGFLFFLATDWWVANALMLKTGAPLLGAWGWTGLFCAYHAIPYCFAGLCAGLGWRAGVRGARWDVWCAASLTVCVCFFPHLFPGNAAHALYRFPMFLQVLDLGGVPLLLFLFACVSWLVAGRLAALAARRRDTRAALCCAMLLVVWAGYGWVRLAQVRGAQAVAEASLVAVQPDVDLTGAGGRERIREQVLNALVLVPHADVIVLPEVPVEISCGPLSRDQQAFAELAHDAGAPLLVNCVEPVATGDAWQNAARLVSPAYSGAALQETSSLYVKRRLVPFGERVPLADSLPWLSSLVPSSRRYEPGDRAVVFTTQSGLRIAPLLCYEALFPDEVRDMVREGAQLLGAMANDAWFVSPRAAQVHLSMVAMRAVEFRRAMVRAGNSSGSAIVAATGEFRAAAPVQPGVAVVHGRETLPEMETFYMRFGDVFLWAMVAMWGVSALAFLRGGRSANPL